MMYGTPVIAHKSGGPMETILDKETGYLYTTNEDLLLFLEKMLELDNGKYLEMQKSAQMQAKNFDVSKSIEKLEEVFKKL